MTQKERIAVVLETGLSLATVIKWDKGEPVSESTDRFVSRVVNDLGFTRKSKNKASN